MNETPDPLEAELKALAPRNLSPAFRRQIAEVLIESPTIRQPQRRRLALIGVLSAACLIAIVVWWGRGGGDSPRIIVQPDNRSPVEPAPPDGPASPADNANWNPRLVTYQRALARSPEELDVLLSREARFVGESQAQLVQFRAFTPSNASLNALLGDN
jgi:hypothetical protein